MSVFEPFFYLLRARGIRVSLNEWLALLQALERGMAQASLTGFYRLCRAVLVKSEADYDKLDGAFLEYFESVGQGGEIPPELLAWLEKADGAQRERAPTEGETDTDEVRRQFELRLQEQDREHHGGHHWIGTDGTSPFGNRGYGDGGIRLGGESERQSAFTVAGERKYRDFRDDKVLDQRRFQVALRSLRQFSTRTDAPMTELSLDKSIQETGRSGGSLKLVFEKPRKNQVKLLLLMDSGGSMDPYAGLCASLFQAASKSNHFADLKIYYFHNCVKDRLYLTPRILRADSVETMWVLHNLDSGYRVVFVGDALMDMSELTGGGHPTGLDWLNRLKEHYPHMVWLTPQRTRPQTFNRWGDSFFLIQRELDMYQLTVEGLRSALKKLMVSK